MSRIRSGRAAVLALVLTSLPIARARAAEFVANHLFVADHATHAIRELDGSGAVVRILAASTLIDPQALAFGPDGFLYVLDERSSLSADDSLVVLSPEGDVLDQKTIGPAATFDATGAHIAFSGTGTLYVSDAIGSQIHEYDVANEAILQTLPAAGLSGAASLTTSPDGHLFAGVSGDPTSVLELQGDGVVVATIVSAATGSTSPVPLLARGGNGALYVLDRPQSAPAKLSGVDLFGSGPPSVDLPGVPFLDMTFGPDGELWLLGGGGNQLVRVAPDLASVTAVPYTPASSGTAIAFAPFQFKVSIKGKAAVAGANPTTIDEKNDRITWFAGSDRAFVSLKDSAASDDLASELSLFSLGLAGSMVPDQDGNSVRAHLSTATRLVIVRTRADAEWRALGSVNGASGSFHPKSVTGSLSISSGDVYFTGTLKSTELLK